MPTINQLIKNKRVKQINRNKVPALQKQPLKRGMYKSLYNYPKKPNSALRKVARVRLSMVLKLQHIFQVKVTIYKNTQLF